MLTKYYLFDFDDTIWSRDNDLIDISIKNLSLLQQLSIKNNVVIISGNSIEHIIDCYNKADIIPNYDIWVNSNSTLFNKFKKEFIIDDFKLSIDLDYVVSLLPEFITPNISFSDCYIKFKPIYGDLRRIICNRINEQFSIDNINAEARATGKTSIDILTKNNNKSKVLDYYKDGYFIFFGDEVDFGNDKDIALNCDEVIRCSSVNDTHRRLIKLCDMD